MTRRGKRGGCGHENADHILAGDPFPDPRDGYAFTFDPGFATCEQFRCLDCGAWLPLGPADDDDPNVAIEIRAAEIAAHKFDMQHRLSSRFKTTHGELAGWRGEEVIAQLEVIGSDGLRRVDHDIPLNLDSPNWRAGYLARCIAEHDVEQT